jgi:hypothetical protein
MGRTWGGRFLGSEVPGVQPAAGGTRTVHLQRHHLNTGASPASSDSVNQKAHLSDTARCDVLSRSRYMLYHAQGFHEAAKHTNITEVLAFFVKEFL